MSTKREAVGVGFDVASGIRWSSIAEIGGQGLRFVSSIVLARLLSPNDYGLMAMATVVTGLLAACRDAGTGAVIVQKKTVSRELLSSLFVLNGGIGVFFFVLLSVFGSVIAEFYQNPEVGPVCQVLGLSFLLGSVGLVDNAVLRREMLFDRLATVTLLVAVVQGGTAISMAYMGYGVWALVGSNVVGELAFSTMMRVRSPWRFELGFRWAHLREVLAFSMNMTAANLVAYLTKGADKLVIGRVLGSSHLGFYSLAYSLCAVPVDAVTGILNRVLFPAMSRLQGDKAELGRAFERAIGGVSFIVCPAMLGLCVVAAPFVEAVLGPKWRPVVPVVMILSPAAMLSSVGFSTSGNVCLAMGRGDIMLWWSFIAAAGVALSAMVGVMWGIVGVALAYGTSLVFLGSLSVIVGCRLVDLPIRNILGAVRPYFFASAVMALVVLACRLGLEQRHYSAWLVLVGCLIVGVITYAVLIICLQPPALADASRAIWRRRRPVAVET